MELSTALLLFVVLLILASVLQRLAARTTQATVTALTYCQLLVLGGRDLRALLRHNPRIKRRIDETASARARLNEAAAWRSSPPGDDHERNQPAPKQGA